MGDVAETTNGFSQVEVEAVCERYTGLVLVDPATLEGRFDLNASYEADIISDSFEVRIAAPTDYPTSLASLTETGGRTHAIARKYGIRDLRKLHRNESGTACLCVKQMERRKVPRGSDLSVFVEALVVPYLYGLSHFDRTGSWPWGEYSHGGLGLLEFYAAGDQHSTRDEIRELATLIRKEPNWKDFYRQITRPSAERMCLCGSGKPFHKCHNRAWNGVVRLNAQLRGHGIKRL